MALRLRLRPLAAGSPLRAGQCCSSCCAKSAAAAPAQPLRAPGSLAGQQRRGLAAAAAAERAGSYPFARIEREWQQYWLAQGTYRTPPLDELDTTKPKFYALDMFPYPSGAGLHVGHPAGYTACDIMARYQRMRGCNVLHPMGWDAFGLPAEQYAIETGTHPARTTAENIEGFRAQLQRLGFSYDWERELSTTSPDYYRWTQWIFLRLHERGLAYRSHAAVNWCPALGTVLANEEVTPEGRSERGDHPVETRHMLQWHLRITAYADRLLDDLDDEALRWPESVKEMQRHWIGRTEGAHLDFAVLGAGGRPGDEEQIRVFSTRAETVFGASALVLSCDHPLVLDDLLRSESQTSDGSGFLGAAQREEVAAFCAETAAAARRGGGAAGQREQPRPRGVPTGRSVVNPLTGAPLPVWVGDYVLQGFGTGAVMCVPAHDTRDHSFASDYGLTIDRIVEPLPDTSTDDDMPECFTGEGRMLPLDTAGWVAGAGQALAAEVAGMATAEARAAVVDWLAEHGAGVRCRHRNHAARPSLRLPTVAMSIHSTRAPQSAPELSVER